MLTRAKARVRARLNAFFLDQLQPLIATIDKSDEANRGQIKALQARIDQLEQIVFKLEESHYRAIGELRPRRDQIFVGEADNFKAVGELFLGHFKVLGALQPDETVLEVGCGIGRIAIPLTKFLTSGRYEGFDIVPSGISWCQENITTQYPNFNFQLADLYNKFYNPGGKLTAQAFVFPYDNGSFDFVFLTSVFTHLLAADMEHYLREIERVMKPGGLCLITYFIWNEDSARLISEGKSPLTFSHELQTCRVQDPAVPESAVCYDERFIVSLYERCGLKIHLPIQYGGWCGRQHFLDGQDIIVASKP